MSETMAKSLAINIPNSLPLNNISSIASAVSLDCISNTQPNSLVTVFSSMDKNNMEPFRCLIRLKFNDI